MTRSQLEISHADIGLSSKEERAELLLNGLAEHAIIILNPHGNIVEWGGAASRITGYAAAEVIGQSLNFLFTEADISEAIPAAELANCLKQERLENKRWHLRKNSSRFFAIGTTTPLYKNGELKVYSKVFSDETERQKEGERRALLLILARHILQSPDTHAKLSQEVFEMIRVPLESDILFNYKLTQNNDLQLVTEVGIPDHLKPAAARLDIGQAFCGNVAATKEPLAANKERICADAAGAFVLQMGVTAYACHPLFSRDGKVIGTFSVASTTRDEYSKSEIEFLQTVSHFMAIAWDRHQAEAQVASVRAESEQRKRLYETILSNTPDLTYVFDLQHRFSYANKILLAMWGKTWDEAIGKTCLELGYEPWHAEMHDREIEQVKKTKLPIRGEVPFAGTFGRRIYDYIFVPILDANGEVEAVAGTTRDITELKQAQEETAKRLEAEKQHAILIGKVAEASQSLNALLSAKSIAQLMAEKARSIIGAHQAIVSISSPNNVTVTAKSISDEFTPQHSQNLEAEILDNKKYLSIPLRGKGEQHLGTLQLSHKYAGEFSSDDEAILGQLAAIASAGIENATMYEKLQEQDRRKDEFLAMLAHELRNPLAPIHNAVAIFERSTLSEPDLKTLKMMERQVKHMVHLIDDLLDVSRISSGKIELKKEQTQLNQIIRSALEVSALAIEANKHELVIVNDGKDILLEVDPIRIAQVITNLLNNAAKYTPAGGQIELITEQDGNTAVICVKDNGVGIVPEMISKIFELFTQAGKTLDRAQGGLGIGLAISKQLIELHQGTITAESDGHGKGAQFTIRLPLSTQPAKSDTQEAMRSVVNSTSAHRILVVDDNIDAADTLSMLLEILGHEVKTTYNGFDALQVTASYQPELVLLDIGLPGMNGYEVAREIISNYPTNRPVLVALTGWGTEEDKQRAQEAGFDHHFTKPIEMEKITQLLNKIWGDANNETQS
ncbi:hybrid sensor histidine kinase/response regulator [Cellvibrio zantedeschiae]|uniref:hybrid sensor histidine kinase/response regulator n=1 Tax=Cellvibrio zantedeschiae TaxID=1237077 RepID=UPI001677487E|nr:PAS domain S-box protein [Cellvibrio zantedeschiae]